MSRSYGNERRIASILQDYWEAGRLIVSWTGLQIIVRKEYVYQRDYCSEQSDHSPVYSMSSVCHRAGKLWKNVEGWQVSFQSVKCTRSNEGWSRDSHIGLSPCTCDYNWKRADCVNLWLVLSQYETFVSARMISRLLEQRVQEVVVDMELQFDEVNYCRQSLARNFSSPVIQNFILILRTRQPYISRNKNMSKATTSVYCPLVVR